MAISTVNYCDSSFILSRETICPRRLIVVITKWSCWRLKPDQKRRPFTRLGVLVSDIKTNVNIRKHSHVNRPKHIHTHRETYNARNATLYYLYPTATVFWTSGTDSANEGNWVWESTNATLPCPGYANWANLQPDNAGNNEDCLALNWRSVEGWNDYPCSNSYQAICEAHP